MAQLDATITAGQLAHISDHEQIASRLNRVFDPRDYGAVGNLVVDDTEAIQDAIDAAATLAIALPGSPVTVDLLGGAFLISTPVKIRSFVHLKNGMLKLAAASDCNMIEQYNVYQEKWTISDLYLVGNKSNQGAGNWRGIFIDSTGWTYLNSALTPQQPDPHPRIERVLIADTKGAGLHLQGSFSGANLTEVSTQKTDREGFVVSASDVWFTDCEAGQSGYEGFLLSGGSPIMQNCKAWFSGRADSTKGYGIRTSANRAIITSYVAQDNFRDGILIEGGECGFLQGLFDSNGSQALGVQTGAGIKITSSITRWRIDAVVMNRAAGENVGSSTHAIWVSGASPDYLSVDLVAEDMTGTEFNGSIGANSILRYIKDDGTRPAMTSPHFRGFAAAATDAVLTGEVSGDAVARFATDAAGTKTWGNGTDARDTTLARGGVGFLAVPMLVKAGVPADADYAVAPPNGTIALNSSTDALYYRKAGTWTALA